MYLLLTLLILLITGVILWLVLSSCTKKRKETYGSQNGKIVRNLATKSPHHTKIAFMFLTVGDLKQSKIWEHFFKNASRRKYSIYIHNKKPLTHKFFKKYTLSNTIDTKWGDISLVRATIQLLREAFANSKNSHFVLLSESCIPLYKFKTIYNRLRRDNIAHIANHGDSSPSLSTLQSKWEYAYKKLKNDRLHINADEFRKQSQWICLTRSDADFFINNDYTDEFENLKSPPDEYYFITLARKFNLPHSTTSLTYCQWPNLGNHPILFSKIDHKQITHARTKGNLFLRKVDENTQINMSELFN